MVLMAIDHVRVYSGLPAGGPTAGIFFTRWITHFCAPAFCFLAGTSAYLYGQKLGDRSKLATFLLQRGLLLVALELTLIRFTWTFNVAYRQFTLAGVIWMLGWCMVLMAALIWLPVAAVGVVGIALVFAQQLFAHLPQQWPWGFIYPVHAEPPEGIAILYVIVPWIGVMAAGYAFGAIVTDRKLCLTIGLAATAAFVVAGLLNHPKSFFDFLNQRKYPASPLFLLMTLGPTITLLALAENWRSGFARVLETFGRVPFVYYLLHIPAIHLTALAVNFLREGSTHGEWYATAPYSYVPPEHRWTLPLLYLVWAIVVAALYFPCRWYSQRKWKIL